MLKTIEYLVFQLLSGTIHADKPEGQLIFSFDSMTDSVKPQSLKPDTEHMQLKKEGVWNIYRYETSRLEAVIYSVMMTKPEKYELHTDLINNMVSAENEGFESMYLKSYYRDLATQVADESTDQYTEVMKELSPSSQPIEKYIDCFSTIRLPFSFEDFSEKVFGFSSKKFQLLTFDGWDGNGKELMIGDEHQIIYLELIYS